MSFSDDIAKFAVKCVENSNKVVRKTVIDISNSLVMQSPVGNPELWASLGASYRFMNKAGTKRLKNPVLEFRRQPPEGYAGGHFRANWQLGIGTMPQGELDTRDKSGGPTMAKIRADLPKEAAGEVYYIANNLDYGPALEEGHSTQAPHGMVGLTVVQFQGTVRAAAQAVNK